MIFFLLILFFLSPSGWWSHSGFQICQANFFSGCSRSSFFLLWWWWLSLNKKQCHCLFFNTWKKWCECYYHLNLASQNGFKKLDDSPEIKKFKNFFIYFLIVRWIQNDFLLLLSNPTWIERSLSHCASNSVASVCVRWVIIIQKIFFFQKLFFDFDFLIFWFFLG